MRSRVITAPKASSDRSQMTLDFEPGLHERFGSLRECIAQGVYQRGLTNVAPSLNKAPGNLSVELSEDPARKFSVDSLEEYIEQFKDTQPIYYLISKFLSDERKPEAEAMAELAPALAQLVPLMRKAGLV